MKEEWEELKTVTKTRNGVTIKYDLSDTYEISNWGKVRRKGKLRERKQRFDAYGYPQISLNKDGKKLMCKVHRLVAETFIPNPYNKETVNHIDGDKTNNRVDNLEWATRLENNQHAIDNGLINTKGELNGNSKLTEAKVREIRDRYDNGCTKYKLAKEYGVSQIQISRIIHRKLWAHV